jgi:serine protease AprX
LIGGGVAGGTDLSNVGIAPKVSLIGLKVLDAKGAGYTSDVIRAIEFAIANRYMLGIDIINLSLGHVPYESAKTDPLVRAVDKATAAGMVVVVAAGNLGINPTTGLPAYGGILSPGNARSAITVGAEHTMGTRTRSDDVIGPYSSRGPTWIDGYAKPDLVAPGHKLLAPVDDNSDLPRKNPSLTSGSSYGPTYLTLTGTSMAAAVTSGVVALVLEANETAVNGSQPALTPNAVKAVLQYTALTMRDASGVVYDRMTQGAGALNAEGALQLARAIDTAHSRYSLMYGVAPVSYIDGSLPWSQFIIWGNNIVWGDSVLRYSASWNQNVIWGDNVTWGDNVVWGDNIVWGDSTIWKTNIVWGDNVVWGDNLIWGENLVWGERLDENVIWGDSILWQ